MPQNKINYSTRAGVVPTPGLGAFSYNLTDRLAFYKDSTKTTRSWNMTTDAEKVASGPIKSALDLKANIDSQQHTGNTKTQNLYVNNGGQSTYYLTSGSSFGLINFDANDYLNYDQTNNLYLFMIGSLSKLTIGTNSVSTSVSLSSPVINITYNGVPNFSLSSLNSTNPYLQFDSNDYINYDQTANKFTFNIAGTSQLTIQTNQANFPGNVGIDNLSIGASGQKNFAITAVDSNTPIINFDANDFLGYDKNNNTLFMVMNGIYPFSANPTEINLNVPVKEQGNRIFSQRQYKASNTNSQTVNQNAETILTTVTFVAYSTNVIIFGESACSSNAPTDVNYLIRVIDQTVGSNYIDTKSRITTNTGGIGYGAAITLFYAMNFLTPGHQYQFQFNVISTQTSVNISGGSFLNVITG